MAKIDKILQRSAEIENPLIFSPGAQEAELSHDNKNKTIQHNFLYIWIGVCFLILLLAGRIFYLQVAKGKYYQGVAENNRIRSIVIKAPRGIIKDKSGEVLARNVPSFDAIFVPADLPKDYNERKNIYRKLGEILGLNESNVESIIESSDFKAREMFLLKERSAQPRFLLKG